MKKKNGGFTLIELMIAVAVLSIMAGVLFQAFVVSRKMNAKARKDEILLDAAKQTMEELKGYRFENLDVLSKESETGTVSIRGTEYEYSFLEDGEAVGDDGENEGPAGKKDAGPADESGEPVKKNAEPSGEPGSEVKTRGAKEGSDSGNDTPRSGYRLVKGYGKDPSGKGPAYLICAEADRSFYGQDEQTDEDEGNTAQTSRSINRYQMPNIADVSSFQNVVIDPQILSRDDELLTAELLIKVNPEEDTDDGESGGEGENSEQSSKQKDTGSEENAEEFGEDDVKRYLQITIDEIEGSSDIDSELKVRVQAVYTVKPLLAEGKPDEGYSITAELASFKKRVVREEKGKLPANRIYLFLPDKGTLLFEQIFVDAALEESIELYAVAANPDDYKRVVGNPIEIRKTGDEVLNLYSNIGDTGLVSLDEARNRLYLLNVTVYEADYSKSGAEADAKPAIGREVLRLDSTKSE